MRGEAGATGSNENSVAAPAQWQARKSWLAHELAASPALIGGGEAAGGMLANVRYAGGDSMPV